MLAPVLVGTMLLFPRRVHVAQHLAGILPPIAVLFALWPVSGGAAQLLSLGGMPFGSCSISLLVAIGKNTPISGKAYDSITNGNPKQITMMSGDQCETRGLYWGVRLWVTRMPWYLAEFEEFPNCRTGGKTDQMDSSKAR